MKQVVEVRFNTRNTMKFNEGVSAGNVQCNFAVEPLDLHCSQKLRTSSLESAVESDAKEVGRLQSY